MDDVVANADTTIADVPDKGVTDPQRLRSLNGGSQKRLGSRRSTDRFSDVITKSHRVLGRGTEPRKRRSSQQNQHDGMAILTELPMDDFTGIGSVDVSAADRVAHELRDAIVTGRFEPGQRISLRQLQDEFGAGQMSIRETLRSLEAEGLLMIHHERSATVATMSGEEVAGILRLRRQIEPALVARATSLHTPGSLADIEQSLARCGDPRMSIEQHRDLHHRVHLDLLRPGMSRWDSGFVEAMLHATSRYRLIEVRQVRTKHRIVLRERDEHVKIHELLLKALHVGDANQAQVLVLDNLAQVEHDMRRWMTAPGREPSL